MKSISTPVRAVPREELEINGQRVIDADDGETVVALVSFDEDAEDIATAVNSFDDLIAALQRSKKWIGEQMQYLGWPPERIENPPEGSHLDAINKALAKAGAL